MAGVLSKRQQARNEKVLYDLVNNIPGNNFCADCHARNPGKPSCPPQPPIDLAVPHVSYDVAALLTIPFLSLSPAWASWSVGFPSPGGPLSLELLSDRLISDEDSC